MATTSAFRQASRDVFFAIPHIADDDASSPFSLNAIGRQPGGTVYVVTGSISGTTLTSTQSAAAHAGSIVMAENGTSRGQCRLVTGVSAGTSLTLHAAFEAVSSAEDTAASTIFSLWQSPIAFRATGNGSTTSVVSALDLLDDNDDTYNGWYIYDWTNNETSLISDYTGSTKTFTLATAVTSSATGMVYSVVQPVFGPGNSTTIEVQSIAQDAATGDYTMRESVPGNVNGSATLSVPWRGLVTAAADGVAAIQDYELDAFLGQQMTRALSTGEVVDNSTSASTTTVVPITNATMTQFSTGSLVLINGEVACITDRAANGANPDLITVSPALVAASATSDVLHGSASYKLNVEAYNMKPMSVMHWLGSQQLRAIIGSCYTCKIQGFKPNEVPRFVFEFGAAHGAFEYPVTRNASHTLQTKPGRSAGRAIVKLGGTRINLIEVGEVDLGFTVQRLEEVTGFQGVGGTIVGKGIPKITLKAWLDDDTYLNMQRALRVTTFLLQLGSVPKNTRALYVHRGQVEMYGAEVSNGGHVATFSIMPLPSNVDSVPSLVLGQM